jgi:NitT/TauT family transport system substrate-binding protein
VLDVRRGDGPKQCFNYTMAAVAATDALIERSPEIAAAAIRAIVKTQQALKNNVELAFEVGRKLFPASEADLIVDLIRRDLPYYDATISPDFVAAMTRFSRDVGILKGRPAYDEVVAAQFRDLWRS